MKKVLALIFSVFSLFMLVSCDGKLDWPEGSLGKLIPQIEEVKGRVVYENMDSLCISLEDLTEDQYLDYISNCKERGFSVEVTEDGNSFVAFNQEGYKIDIIYFTTGDMSISVHVPILMSAISWPSGGVATVIPKPKSNYGKIDLETSNSLMVYVGNTTKEEYSNYVDSVFTLGFSIDYRRDDTYFNAENANGFQVYLSYEGFNTMYIRVHAPDKNNIDTDDAHTESSGGTDSMDLIDGMRPEIKKAIDDYEAFFDEYCAFMKKYNTSDNPLGLMTDYLSFMTQYTETMKSLGEIGDKDLNTVEALYYTEAMARINQKLLEIY